MSIQRKIAIYLLALAFFAGAIMVGLAQVSAAPPPPQPVASETFQDWQYQIWTESDGYSLAQVEYKADTIQSLQNYVALNKALTAQLFQDGLKDFAVIVTFNRPLPLDDFRAWVAATHLNVNGFTLRVMAKDGSRVTVGGAPTGGQLIEDARLKSILDRVAEHGATDVRGFISVEGVVAAADYNQLIANNDVFLVDVTRSVIRQRLAKVAPSVHLDLSAIVVPPTFPIMEDLGLVVSR